MARHVRAITSSKSVSLRKDTLKKAHLGKVGIPTRGRIEGVRSDGRKREAKISHGGMAFDRFDESHKRQKSHNSSKQFKSYTKTYQSKHVNSGFYEDEGSFDPEETVVESSSGSDSEDSSESMIDWEGARDERYELVEEMNFMEDSEADGEGQELEEIMDPQDIIDAITNPINNQRLVLHNTLDNTLKPLSTMFKAIYQTLAEKEDCLQHHVQDLYQITCNSMATIDSRWNEFIAGQDEYKNQLKALEIRLIKSNKKRKDLLIDSKRLLDEKKIKHDKEKKEFGERLNPIKAKATQRLNEVFKS